MALDLSGFIAPEQKFEWIGKIGEIKAANKAAKDAAAKAAETKKEASTKYFQNYIGEQYKFTGTPYDSVARQLTEDALNTAKEYINKGADWGTINSIVQDKVKTLSDYSYKAQAYDKSKKETLAQYNGLAGVNYNNLSKGTDQAAFGQGIDKFDPSKNYVQIAAATAPDIFNTEGFADFAKTSGKIKEGVTVATKDASGKSVKRNLTVEKPAYLISEKSADGTHNDFVPKYEIAQAENGDIIGQFFTDKGVQGHPIRMLDDQVFESFKSNQKLAPMYGYAFQEANKYAQAHGIPSGDPKIKSLAKAIAYDELNLPSNKPTSVMQGETVIQPQVNVSVSGGKPTESEKREEADTQSLINTFEKRTPDANGFKNAIDVLGGIPIRIGGAVSKKYKSIKFNPESQTVVLTPANASLPETTMTIDEAISSVDSESDKAKYRRMKRVGVSKPTRTEKVKAGVKKAVQAGKGWVDNLLNKK